MDTLELSGYLRQAVPRAFVFVCAEDELPETNQRPAAIIVNTDSSRYYGTHWTAIYLASNGRGEFFDSYGIGPDLIVARYLRRMTSSGYDYNKRCLQSPFSTLCGAYCIDFLTLRHENSRVDFKRLVDKMYPFRDTWINDLEVHRRFKDRFGVSLKIVDSKYLFGSLV